MPPDHKCSYVQRVDQVGISNVRILSCTAHLIRWLPLSTDRHIRRCKYCAIMRLLKAPLLSAEDAGQDAATSTSTRRDATASKADTKKGKGTKGECQRAQEKAPRGGEGALREAGATGDRTALPPSFVLSHIAVNTASPGQNSQVRGLLLSGCQLHVLLRPSARGW